MRLDFPDSALTLAPILALLLTGCGGGEESFPPPSNLKVEWYTSLGHQKVTWQESGAVFDGYEFERKVGTGAFANQFNGTLSHLSKPEFGISFGDHYQEMPEGVDLHYRMRYVKDSRRSDYSNVFTTRAQIRPPWVSFLEMTGPAVSLSWTNNSELADTLLVERGTGSVGNAIGGWQPLVGVTFGMTTCLDEERPEDPFVAYRVTFSKGADSGSRTALAIQNPLRAPSNLQATPAAGWVDLSWRSTSSMASELVVMRRVEDVSGDWEEVAHLPTSAMDYRDTACPDRLCSYRIESRAEGRVAGKSVEVMARQLVEDHGAVAFTTTTATMPSADLGLRHTGGEWAFATSGIGAFDLWLPVGASWTRTTHPNRGALIFRMDSQGRIHTLGTNQVVDTTDQWAIVHHWHDGSTLRSEELFRWTKQGTLNPWIALTLDAQDRPHAVWDTGEASRPDRWQYCHRETDGTWVREVLPVPQDLYWARSALLLELTSDGRPVVLVDTSLGTRPDGGEWTWNRATDVTFDRREVQLVVEADGRIDILYFKIDSWDNRELRCRSLQNGGWEEEQILLNLAGLPYTNYVVEELRADLSPSGARVAATLSTPWGNYVAMKEAGIWRILRLSMGTGTHPLLGWDGADRLHLLERGRPVGFTGLASYAVYREVR